MTDVLDRLDQLPEDRRAEIQRRLLERARTRKAEGTATAAADGDGLRPGLAGPGPVEPSYGQERLWFLDRLDPGRPTYHIPAAVHLTGDVGVAAFTDAWNEVRRRHEPLRTDFPSTGGRPLQRIRPARPARLPLADLTGLADGDRRRELDRLTDSVVLRPFRIAETPPVRARWVRVAPGEHAFLLCMHHLVADGASVGILVDELSSLYGTSRSGEPSSLAEPEIRYADWVVRERRLPASRLDDSRAYWRERLAGLPPLLPLPTDRPRRAVARHRGSIHAARLDAATVGSLDALARSRRTTFFAVLAATFTAVLRHWSGAKDVPLGVPVAGRRGRRTRSLVGLFVDTVVLRPDLSDSPTFVEWVDRLRTEALGAFSHQDLPFERLVEDLGVPRSRSHAPIFQALLTLNEAADVGSGLPGVDLTLEEPHTGTAKFDLTLTVVRESDGGAKLTLEVDRDLFDATTARRVVERLARIARTVAVEPDRNVERLPYLSDAERHLLTREWCAADGGPDTAPFLLHERFFTQARRHPDAVAVVDGDRRRTHGELARDARALARRLRSLGAGPDTLVGLYAGRSLDTVVGLVGILAAGAAYLPLDPDYPAERVAFVLDDADVRMVVTTREHAAAVPDDLHVVALDAPDRLPEDAPSPATTATTPVTPDHLAYVIYTSGSTGRPKGVAVTHGNASRLWAATGLDFGPQDVWTLFHSPAFDFSVWEIWGALLYGGRLVVVPYLTSRSPEDTLRLLADEGVTVLSQTPSAFLQLQDAALGDEAPELSLRKVIFGGEALQPAALRPWMDRHGDGADGRGPELINMYGITETTVHVTRRPVRRDDLTAPWSPLGRPLTDLTVHLLAPGGVGPAPLGALGEIGVGGAGLARGYLERPGRTAERFVPHPWGPPGSRLYRSGDLARYRADGDVEYLGRLDHQVQLRGFRVELGEIEAVLEACPGVAEAVVVPVDAGDGNGRVERLAAWVRTAGSDRATAPDAAALRARLIERLPEFMVPSRWFLRSELPSTPTGKVDRRALRRAAREERPGAATGAAYVAPDTPTAEVVAGIWSDVLDVERVGLHDDFFALGGHSLLATRVVSRLQEALGATVPVAALFEAPTVAGLVDRLAVHDGAPPRLPPVRRRDPSGPQPLSASQLREWFLDRMQPGNPAYHVTAALRFDGPLDPAPLRQAMGEVVRRHETLRTVFPLSADGDPVQEIRDPAPLALPRVDLSGLDPARRDAAARRLARAAVEQPFDLVHGPVVRWRWLRLAPRDTVLSWVVHHVAADGWSLGVLTRELGHLYAAYAAGRPSALEELPVRYVDYARTQAEFLDGPGGEALAAAWKERLTPAPTPLELPADRPRGGQAHQAAGLPFRLESDAWTALQALARRRGASPFMVLLGALAGFLGRLTGAGELVVGTFVAGRERPEIEPLVGFFVNSLPLSIDLGGEPTFATLLERVRETTLSAYALQSLPFERLLETLDVERSMTRSPLFQVLLVLQNHPLGTVELGGASGRRFGDDRPDTGLDLTWWAEEADGGLAGMLEYAAHRFDATTARRWRDAWQRLLESALAAPEAPVRELPVLSEAQRHQVTREWSTGEGLEPASFLERFRRQATRRPDRIAVVDAAAGACLTYAGLAARADRLAADLTRAGVGLEDRVALRMPRSMELLTAMLAVHVAGAAWVPLDPTWPTARTAWMAENAGARAILDRLEDAGAGAAGAPETGDDLPPEAAAYVVYTSGSTGRPKGVVVSRGSLSWYAAAAVDHYGLEPEDRVLQFSSPSFDASVEEIFPTLSRGAALVLRDEASAGSAAAFYRLCRDHGVTIASTPTAFWHELAAQDLPETGWPPALRQVILGGERVRPERVAAWRAAVGSRTALVNTYGPTEATVVATLEPIRSLPADGRDVPIGRPVPGARAGVSDRHVEPAFPGAVGELLLGGPGVARGYLGHPAATAAAFLPDPASPTPGGRLYATGDRARLRADGRLEFRGRTDSQVKIRGFRVEPGEVEDVLGRHPAVADVAVVARRDRETPYLAAFLEAAETGDALPEQELRSFLAERLPAWMVPRIFTAVDALPKTPAGKIDRRRLRESPLELGDRPDVAEYVAPRTPTEEVLADIWAECLEVDRVGVLDDFFQLGGHSLLLTRITARMRDALGVDVPLATFFEAPTVAALAREVETSTRPPLPPIERQPRDGRDLPVSFSQERLWFLSRLDPASGSYHVPRVLILDGDLSSVALDGAYQAVMERQEVLRTTFPVVDGRPVQRIHPTPTRFAVPRVELTRLAAPDRDAETTRLVDVLGRRTFDPERGPLLRVFLLRLDPRHHRVIQNEHHLVHDGWTEGVLLRDLTVLYGAFVQGDPSPLPRLPYQFADFAAWQRRWLTGDVLDEQLAYWTDHLRDAPELTELPTDRPRPAVLAPVGDAYNPALSPATSQRLAAASRRRGVTVFMSMLAAFDALLHRWSGQTDLVVGTGVANRRHRETENLVGMVINTLALRVRIAGDPTFTDLLDEVREVCLGAYTHEDLPFEKMVEALRPTRSLSHAPVFQVLFAFHDAPHEWADLPGLRMSDEAVHNRSAKFDLVLIVTPPDAHHDDTVIHVEWNTELFDNTTIYRFMDQYVRLLDDTVEHPERRVSELRGLGAAERHQVTWEWSGSERAAAGDPATALDLFEARAAETPDAPALVADGEAVSYGELDSRARRLAHRLRRRGAGWETPVAVFLERSTALVTSLLAIWKAGGFYVPLDPTDPDRRLAALLDDVGIRRVVTDAEGAGRLDTLGQGRRLEVVRVDDEPRDPEIDGEPENLRRPAADALAYVLFTSGSTGRPKGVAVSHRAVARLVRRPGHAPVTTEDGFLLLAPTAFDASTFEMWTPLAHGARLAVPPPGPLSLHEVAETIRRFGVTVLWLTAGLFHQMVEHRLDALRPLRRLLAGGDVLAPEAVTRVLRELPGLVLVNGYGPTEATTFTTCHPMHGPRDVAATSVPVGRPIDGTEARILDRCGRPTPAAVPGALFAGGDGLARGYFGQPARTAERFVPHGGSDRPGARLYATGDRARWLADGRVELSGRLDHQVKIRGFRIEPGEIEGALARHPAVTVAAVRAVADDDGNRSLVAWVEPTASVEPEELGRFLEARLPRHLVPSRILLRDRLPLTPSGKVDRRTLALEADEATPGSRRVHVPPETPMARRLAQIWREILGVDAVGMEDDFFELGGHSLLATQVLHRIEEEFGVEIALRRLFESPTLASLELAVTEAQAAGTDEAELLALLDQVEEAP